MRLQRHALPSPTPGTSRELLSLHFGKGRSGRKAYVQCALHADEVPALLVGVHLRTRLQTLDDQGLIDGEIILVPAANPIGLSQEIQGSHMGRFDLGTGTNFNRNYRHLTGPLIERVQDLLGADAKRNTVVIRQAIRDLLSAWNPSSETETLKQRLQIMAMDADVVLDLHCDNEALVHVYAGTPLTDLALPLAHALGAEALLVARVSGDDPFDESVSRVWWELAEHFAGRFPIDCACFSATVELRGEADVDHALATQDADALVRFLVHTGDIAAAATDLLPPEPVNTPACAATPLEAVDPIVAPQGGILVYSRALGSQIAAGEAIGEVIDPLTGQSMPLISRATGTLFARLARRHISRGARVAKVAGTVAFRTGKLLSL